MTKIAFIGAGSLGFTGELVRDILTFPLLEDGCLPHYADPHRHRPRRHPEARARRQSRHRPPRHLPDLVLHCAIDAALFLRLQPREARPAGDGHDPPPARLHGLRRDHLRLALAVRAHRQHVLRDRPARRR